MSDVRARIRARCAGEGNPSPAVVSQDVLDDLADGELRAALKVALPYLVRDEIRKLRHDAIGKAPDRGGAEARQWEGMAQPGGEIPKRRQEAAETAAKLRAAGRKGQQASQARRDHEAALLSIPISIRGEWKALGQCTAEDLHAIADAHQEDADQRAAKAEGYRNLARLVQDAGVATVRGLDAAKAREAFDAIA